MPVTLPMNWKRVAASLPESPLGAGSRFGPGGGDPEDPPIVEFRDVIDRAGAHGRPGDTCRWTGRLGKPLHRSHPQSDSSWSDVVDRSGSSILATTMVDGLPIIDADGLGGRVQPP